MYYSITNDFSDLSATGVEKATATAQVATGTQTYDVTGLTDGTTYYFAVVATNSKGNSPAGISVQHTISEDQSTVPGAPTNVSVANTGTPGAGQVTVTWKDSTDPGKVADGTADTITGYDVYYSTTNDFSDLAATAVKKATSSSGQVSIGTYKLVVTGLTSGTVYYFAIVATNTKGNSPAGISEETTVYQQTTAPTNYVLVKGGTFTMGSPSTEANRESNETQHEVTVSSFYISRHEVTQKEWSDVMGTTPSKLTGDKLPVESVTWYDAVAYCNALSVKEGYEEVYSISGITRSGNEITGATVTADFTKKGYRLPTEAEWEYAARGWQKSSGYKIYSGSDTVDDVAWYSSNSNSITHEVGTKNANELGLYDMSGNVWEWCWNWYGEYSSDARTDPPGPTSGSFRVRRGGSWSNDARYVRVAYRDYYSPGVSVSDMGFRPLLPAVP